VRAAFIASHQSLGWVTEQAPKRTPIYMTVHAIRASMRIGRHRRSHPGDARAPQAQESGSNLSRFPDTPNHDRLPDQPTSRAEALTLKQREWVIDVAIFLSAFLDAGPFGTEKHVKSEENG
jgi:hypothetical protein